MFVAFQGGRLVGFLSLYRPDNFVHSLFADPPGHGVGPALLRVVAGTLSSPLSLKCADRNHDAMRFYLREGFTPIDRGVTDGRAWTRLRAPTGG